MCKAKVIQLTILFFLSCTILVSAQIGIKAGLNFANVTNTSTFDNSIRSGFHAGIFITPNPNRLIGFHTELLYSRQGYNFKDKSNTGSVDLNYILIPTYISFNFTRFLSVMGGLNFAYLIDAKADTIPTSGGSPHIDVTKYYKKLDFGFGVGAETHPIGGLVIGARLNYSLGNLVDYINDPNNFSKNNFIPKINVKNNLFQIYTGWMFGGYRKYQ